MHALMQTRIWNRNCEKRRFKALLESRLAFWLRRGLGSDTRACACNRIRSRGGFSLALRSLTQSDAVARRGRCRLSAKTRQQPALLCCQEKGSDRSGLSAPLSAAATSLIGGGKLPFFALRLFPLAVLAPAPDRLGAASHRDEPNNQLDDLHAATQFLEPDWIARCSTAPSLKCQSPLTLRSSGFDRTTISRLPDRCQH
jgi:hypothetical protein